ncbi:hypothetical protein NBO_554g0001 [Nosema bombycis CQ1]|uniref:Uncharacterized protein n=1 Tax=Nosema bombycis (strain CQ1 / CVCC 102059) TaxID=578461 RepID=R0M226_NOSB1|nr:hypothetical protein NBO_554g0001 [Nosema bombycis CQ1]|eukprot:EOB12084.1 hypothetical protein NBO_554g0001 [Nosema bombycis CQ1]
MENYDLSKFIDNKILTQNKICISETLPQNVDFLIKDITDIIGNTSLFSFNERALHFRSILSGRVLVGSIYDRPYSSEFILDDVYIGRKLFNVKITSNIVIFRANTCKKVDYYDYDIIIKVEPLKSGRCTKFDGMITIINRKGAFNMFKYKRYRDRTYYYDT